MTGRHFTIHLNRFDFTLMKNVEGNTATYPQDFIFHVTYGADVYPISIGSNGGTEVIKGLLYGKSTQVSAAEDESWSWRYEGSNSSNPVAVASHTVTYGTAPTLTNPAPIVFTNTLDNDQWLGGTARVDNHYGVTN